jgi:phage shock protein A
MSLLGRLANLWTGFWSLFIADLEVKNPEAVYESAIDQKIATHQRLKKAVSSIVYLRNKLQKEYDAMRDELHQVVPELQVAIEQGQDDVALVLIQKKETLEKRMASHESELEKVKQQAEDSKASLVAFQAEIEKLRREKDEMIAKKATAEARIEIQEMLDGITTNDNIKALDNVRQGIEKLHAEADVSSEISGSSLDARLKKIREQTGASTAKAKLDEMKRQLAARQTATQ